MPEPDGIGRRRFAVGALGLAGATLLGGADPACAEVNVQPAWPEVAEALPQARLQGQGRFRWFGLAVYDASLWVAGAPLVRGDEPRPLALTLVYARNFTAAEIAARSIDEMQRQGPLSLAEAEAWHAWLLQALRDVRAGDRLTGVHWPDRGARFFHNREPTHTIGDAKFARRFFAIWLSSRTTAPALRAALLGQVS